MKKSNSQRCPKENMSKPRLWERVRTCELKAQLLAVELGKLVSEFIKEDKSEKEKQGVDLWKQNS